MKKLLLSTLAFVLLVLLIPIIIVGRIGPGIKVPAVITNIVQGEASEASKVSGENTAQEVADDNIKIKVYSDEDKKIIEMSLEDYLVGVLSGEVPALFEPEALKAQAVAARTYAVSHLAMFGGKGCTQHEGADVCSDVHCQVWMSKEERFRTWKAEQAAQYWNNLEQAVKATEGQVLTYDGKLAGAVKYFAASGGRTEDSKEVFGTSVPYLVSVDSPGEEGSPSYKSTVTYSTSEFITRMKKISSDIKISESTPLSSQIKINSLTPGGRVKSIKIGDKTFSGVDIRWGMGLKSANFNITTNSKGITFTVFGSGHGVGMSQWGAQEMAKKGSSYSDILKHYYSQIQIMKIKEINEYRNTKK